MKTTGNTNCVYTASFVDSSKTFLLTRGKTKPSLCSCSPKSRPIFPRVQTANFGGALNFSLKYFLASWRITSKDSNRRKGMLKNFIVSHVTWTLYLDMTDNGIRAWVSVTRHNNHVKSEIHQNSRGCFPRQISLPADVIWGSFVTHWMREFYWILLHIEHFNHT